MPLRQPPSVAELGEEVRRAAADGRAVYPLGGRTMLGYGLPPARPGIGLDTRRLDRVIDYPARDMTITVQAGITLARLQETLAAENQRLPVDVPRPAEATLGGALATNTSGPRRYGFGTLRDYVIGISVVNDEGQETKAGGRVVKNVAGYDLCKLYVGSLGTLGVITQVTLKLKPRPEEQALVLAGCPDGGLDALLDRLHGSGTRPVCVDVLNRSAVDAVRQTTGTAWPEAPWVAVVGFEDNPDAVNWQVQRLVKELSAAGVQGLDVHLGSTADAYWRALVEFPARLEAPLTFKANLLPHQAGSFCRAAAALPGRLLLQAHAGNGIVVGHAAADLTLGQATEMLKGLQSLTGEGQGNVVLLRCPAAWKKVLPVWGTPRGDWGLMRAIKDKLDPRGLFNPGRFVDGI